MMVYGKLFALILAAIVVACGVFFGLVVLQVISVLALQQRLVAGVLFFTHHWLYQVLGLLITAACVFVGLLLIRFILWRGDSSVLTHTPQGDIRISFNSIKALARQALKHNPDILSLDPEVKKAGNSARLLLRLVIRDTVSITDFSPVIQSTIRDTIERQAGITLKDVKLFIDILSEDNSIQQEFQARE